jgi:choline dehydrogenase-like flavoprotein
MIVDGRAVERGSVLPCDVCIVGSGPAGLIAANEFLDGGCRVIVLESGAEEADKPTQQLGSAEVEENDDLYPDPMYSHDRRIGGTSAQWDVMIDGKVHVHLMPLDPIDFRRRDWIPNSGWPIDHPTLVPYFERAQMAAGAGPFDYEPQSWVDDASPPFDSPHFKNKVVSFGVQRHFQFALPQRIAESRNVTLVTWSTATELVVQSGGEVVSAIRVACLNGNRFQIAPRIVILAQGAFEVPRLLLASRSVASEGLGNRYGLVGRYLMDRQIAKTGNLVPIGPDGLRRFTFYDMRRIREQHVLGKFSLSDSTMQSERILGNLVSFSPRVRFSFYDLMQRPFGRGTTSRSPAQRSLRDLKTAWRARRFPSAALRHAKNIALGLDDLLYLRIIRRLTYRPEFNFDSLGWTALNDFDRRFSLLEVHQMCEQSPDFNNRITLTDAMDATGMPKARVIFRWNELDIRSVTRTQDIVSAELARASIGRLQVDRRGELPLLAQVSSHHPSGTTRMAGNAREGVVDADCRVYGVDNLYIASSSVFPTSGLAPPTLTTLALAIRVCDRVKVQLAKQAIPVTHEIL